ncbi:uncharacterized protein [Canis lupus baileyi]|uniref:guanylate-binding protein 4-like n=1 Tax=Canis lupus dingo TaxID=286419 RepID=UPI0018F3A6FF|nr:guanylate-binding protein 4-like [Canis lupus dingo]
MATLHFVPWKSTEVLMAEDSDGDLYGCLQQWNGSLSRQCGDTPVYCEKIVTLQSEIPTKMVLALPHLDSEAIITAESSQYEELQQQYMDLLQIKNELEESCIKKDKLLRDVQQALAEEQAKREAAEKEKQLLEERCKQLQKRVELLEKCFKESMIQMKEQIKREREVLLKEQNKRIERLEAQMKNMANNQKSAKNYPTLMVMADDSEEDIPQPSCWSKICELIQELWSLIVKFFSCG